MIETYSVSKLKEYSSCPASYRHKYILKTPYRSGSRSTLMGSTVHESLEEFYRGENWLDKPFIDTFTAVSLNSLRTVFSLQCDSEILLDIHTRLMDLAMCTDQLHVRASPSYRGEDAIRKGNGEVASKPEITAAWKKALAELNIEGTTDRLNQEMLDINPELDGLEPVSAFTDAVSLALGYRHPREISSIIAVEMPFSAAEDGILQNPVLMPDNYGGSEGIYFKGYIDLVCEVNGELAILDHKTSKEVVTPDMVRHNAQLSGYAWAYRKLTGKTVKYIGINHIRTSQLILQECVPAISVESFRNLAANYTAIKYGLFPKKAPDTEYSSCLKSFGSTCPFLSQCHPHYNN